MAESTAGWFGVREKYCPLTDKSWLISQIRPNEQAVETTKYSSAVQSSIKHHQSTEQLRIPMCAKYIMKATLL